MEAGGMPAVFVHGFCQSSAYWRPTCARLERAGMAAIAPDLPGFGGGADLPGPYTMEAYADWLAASLSARGMERIVLVGGSMGGVVAQHFVLRHPGRVARLLLVATGAATADPPGALAKADAMAAAAWDEAAVAPIVAGFFYTAPPPDDLARYRAIALQARQAAAVEAARSNARSNTFGRLGEIGCPTLIIQGRHDRARTPEHGALMRTRMRVADLAVLEGSGHTPQLEEPEAFLALAIPFLSGQSR
jgi:3-oxoadipate enol-lactonase